MDTEAPRQTLGQLEENPASAEPAHTHRNAVALGVIGLLTAAVVGVFYLIDLQPASRMTSARRIVQQGQDWPTTRNRLEQLGCAIELGPHKPGLHKVFVTVCPLQDRLHDLLDSLDYTLGLSNGLHSWVAVPTITVYLNESGTSMTRASFSHE